MSVQNTSSHIAFILFLSLYLPLWIFINVSVTFSKLSEFFLYVPQHKRGSLLIFESALYSSLYGIYVYKKAQYLPNMLISVGIDTETWNVDEVIAVLIFHHQQLRTSGKIPTVFTFIIWNEMQDITDYFGMLHSLTESVISNTDSQQLYVYL